MRTAALARGATIVLGACLLAALSACAAGEAATGVPKEDQPAVAARALELLPAKIAEADLTPEDPPTEAEQVAAGKAALVQALAEYRQAHPEAQTGWLDKVWNWARLVFMAAGATNIGFGLFSERWRSLLKILLGALNPTTGPGPQPVVAFNALLGMLGPKHTSEVQKLAAPVVPATT